MDARRQLQAQIRKNVTETLVSLRVNTVDDIQQIAAALAQCTVGWAPGSVAAPILARSPWPCACLGPFGYVSLRCDCAGWPRA